MGVFQGEEDARRARKHQEERILKERRELALKEQQRKALYECVPWVFGLGPPLVRLCGEHLTCVYVRVLPPVRLCAIGSCSSSSSENAHAGKPRLSAHMPSALASNSRKHARPKLCVPVCVVHPTLPPVSRVMSCQAEHEEKLARERANQAEVLRQIEERAAARRAVEEIKFREKEVIAKRDAEREIRIKMVKEEKRKQLAAEGGCCESVDGAKWLVVQSLRLTWGVAHVRHLI